MTLLKIWGVILILAAAFVALDSESALRQAQTERCANTRCI
ncbi:hypothetical protein [Caballeronia cordobensis]|nr:hypothetical protein BRPE67_BCDS10390 [Burkholderia sp. RPE67]